MKTFAVLGSWRGGTSLVTSVLQALGVFVGDKFFSTDGYCTYEDVRLRHACLDCFDERPGRWCYSGTRAERVERLRQWIRWARERAVEEGAIGCGGKHPVMCKLVDELWEAWSSESPRQTVFVVVKRNPNEIHRSWTRLQAHGFQPWWPRSDREYVVDDLLRSRDTCLREKQVVGIDFEMLRANPEATIASFVQQCGLDDRRVLRAASRINRKSAENAVVPR